MAFLVHQLIEQCARTSPQAPALVYQDQTLNYTDLHTSITRWAIGLRALGLTDNQRVALYLPKQFPAVFGIFASMAAGGIAVPINPGLKAAQVQHILRDSGASIVLTHSTRAAVLLDHLANCPALQHLIILDTQPDETATMEVPVTVHSGHVFDHTVTVPLPARIDADIAAILYTSGSTGLAKGVVLSHANLIAGAQSVVSYLHNTADDRLLAVLPLSFDYGLSQLTCAFSVGASVVLLDYLVPNDIIQAVPRYAITGLAAVPSLWQKLARLDWPAISHLRYITSSGGALPLPTIQALQQALPKTELFVMYGLTEAFRSTYLPPDQLQQRPNSIGKAIPNAQLLLLNAAGETCAIDEPGELVHRGALVAQGYWNNPQASAACFKPIPNQPAGTPRPERAAWSGDLMRRDAEGYLYFIGRRDAQIKSAGYRISPDEIETVVSNLPDVSLAVAQGVPHPALGQAIVLWVQATCSIAVLQGYCRTHLPNFMLPLDYVVLPELPLNQNGKPDRAALLDDYL